jgi:hypothetical protein
VLQPIVFLFPVLALLDYWLTIAGVRLAHRGYHLHFRFEEYELNPLWQQAVRSQRWINPRHVIMVVVVTVFLIVVTWSGVMAGPDLDFLLGLIFTAQGMIIGAHLGNLITSHHVSAHPEDVNGEVSIAHRMSLVTAQGRTVSFLVPVTILALLSRNAAVLGGAVGLLVVLCAQGLWRLRASRRASATPGARV